MERICQLISSQVFDKDMDAYSVENDSTAYGNDRQAFDEGMGASSVENDSTNYGMDTQAFDKDMDALFAGYNRNKNCST